MSTGQSLDPLPKSVKPRSRDYLRHPVIAVHKYEALTEDGQILDVATLKDRLPKMKPTLFVMVYAPDFLAELDMLYSRMTPSTWQFRISHHERDICRPDGTRVASKVSVAVSYFGWKNGNYHKLIDPVTMYGKSLRDIWSDPIFPDEDDSDASDLRRLLAWGLALRDFCHENMIDVRPTTGGISGQFWTDKRFYPNPRRKVPFKTNEAVREHQPGNYYRLMVEPTPDREFTATYLDQQRAHHYHAQRIKFPHADQLYAYGRFHDLAEVVFDHTVDDFYGLYCLDLKFKRNGGQRAYGWIEGYDRTWEKQFVWSNELQHIKDMGFQVTGVRAAWGSLKQDKGISKYAAWADSELDRYQNAAWLKPLLLSAYGVLAMRPRYSESVFKLACKGEPVTIPTGFHSLTGFHTKSRIKLEPPIANVLHRGMIEAATRSESVGLAQWLTGLGYHILSIYADAVIVEDYEDKPLPDVFNDGKPWRSKGTLTHLQFINQQAFVSGQMTKLPGVGHQEYRQVVQTRNPPRPRPQTLNSIEVAELMEQEEFINSLITTNGEQNGNAES